MTAIASTAMVRLRLDPALPARDLLLDDAAAAEVFADTLGLSGRLPVDRVERLRVKYRIGESLRCVHRVSAEGRSWLVATRMRADGLADLYAEALRREHPCPPLRGVSRHERLQSVFWTFPNDRRLDGIDALSPELSAIRLAWPGRRLSMAVVGYNPERAVIARVTDADGRTLGFAKVFAEGGVEPARRALDWLAQAIRETGAPLRVPAVRGCDVSRRVLVLSAVEGVHLVDVADADLAHVFDGLGATLGLLHGLPLPSEASALPSREAFDAAALTGAATAIGWARPDLARSARRTADLLAARRPAADVLVGLHGDMNSRNWLVAARSGSVGLIDFDEASAGPAAVDLAGVLGWLRTRTLTGEWTSDREQAVADAFLRGYAEVRPLPAEPVLRWFAAAALLVERAQRSITRVRPESLACLDRLVAAAHESAQEFAHA